MPSQLHRISLLPASPYNAQHEVDFLDIRWIEKFTEHLNAEHRILAADLSPGQSKVVWVIGPGSEKLARHIVDHTTSHTALHTICYTDEQLCVADLNDFSYRQEFDLIVVVNIQAWVPENGITPLIMAMRNVLHACGIIEMQGVGVGAFREANTSYKDGTPDGFEAALKSVTSKAWNNFFYKDYFTSLDDLHLWYDQYWFEIPVDSSPLAKSQQADCLRLIFERESERSEYSHDQDMYQLAIKQLELGNVHVVGVCALILQVGFYPSAHDYVESQERTARKQADTEVEDLRESLHALIIRVRDS